VFTCNLNVKVGLLLMTSLSKIIIIYKILFTKFINTPSPFDSVSYF